MRHSYHDVEKKLQDICTTRRELSEIASPIFPFKKLETKEGENKTDEKREMMNT